MCESPRNHDTFTRQTPRRADHGACSHRRRLAGDHRPAGPDRRGSLDLRNHRHRGRALQHRREQQARHQAPCPVRRRLLVRLQQQRIRRQRHFVLLDHRPPAERRVRLPDADPVDGYGDPLPRRRRVPVRAQPCRSDRDRRRSGQAPGRRQLRRHRHDGHASGGSGLQRRHDRPAGRLGTATLPPCRPCEPTRRYSSSAARSS